MRTRLAGMMAGMALGLCLSGLGAVAAQDQPARFQQGQEIFKANCADCHRSSGEGLPGVFPALKGNAFVTGEPEAVIQTLLAGRKGKIGTMPSYQDKLSDEQLAAVITYIRNGWGNQAAAVTPDQVAKKRKK